MTSPIELVGPDRALQIFGIRMIGFDAVTLRRLAITIAFFIAIVALAALLRAGARAVFRHHRNIRVRFITQQVISLVSTILFAVVLMSIWFDNPGRLASAAALVTAGLAIASQKFVMSLIGYLTILRGSTFKVGDRITMGGVRGDVIALGYIRTTIMEMGQPPAVQDADPAMWVEARQYTGRIVSVTNDKIFDEPVYNFTRELPFLFEEMKLPIRYTADRKKAEEILLAVIHRHTVSYRDLAQSHVDALQRRYFLRDTSLAPRVYMRLTDNWLELTARFLVREHGIREVKDAITREVLDALDEAGIEVASATFAITDLPPLRLERAPARS